MSRERLVFSTCIVCCAINVHHAGLEAKTPRGLVSDQLSHLLLPWTTTANVKLMLSLTHRQRRLLITSFHSKSAGRKGRGRQIIPVSLPHFSLRASIHFPDRRSQSSQAVTESKLANRNQTIWRMFSRLSINPSWLLSLNVHTLPPHTQRHLTCCLCYTVLSYKKKCATRWRIKSEQQHWTYFYDLFFHKIVTFWGI